LLFFLMVDAHSKGYFSLIREFDGIADPVDQDLAEPPRVSPKVGGDFRLE
jgi:hypothetical protein